MEGYFIVGEKSQCEQCFAFVPAAEAVKDGSHTYCSEPCQKKAAAESRVARIEFQVLAGGGE
jgi:hypothetical protein